jgi:hypothetical protein
MSEKRDEALLERWNSGDDEDRISALAELFEKVETIPEFSMDELESPITHDRVESPDRSFQFQFYGNATASLGKIHKGMNRFGFTKGQWSLIDLIGACVAQIGPCDMAISTWTAANKDIGVAFQLLEEGRIRSARWILDVSFKARQPVYMQALLLRFGLNAVRVTMTHAKFCILTNEDYNLVIRTSMNLNANKRWEFWEISDDKAFADFFVAMVDEIFEGQEAGAFVNDPGAILNQFKQITGIKLDDRAMAAAMEDLEGEKKHKRAKGQKKVVQSTGFHKL